MHRLDNFKAIKKLDQQGMIGSIESLALQCQQARDDVSTIRIPAAYRSARTIWFNGMGGSALGADVVRHAFQARLAVPFIVTNQYRVPRFVDRHTLAICSSYSGTTEEVTASLTEARKRTNKILLIGAGGVLAAQAKQHHIPAYIFDPRFNPSNQPRMGLGYSLIGVLSLLQQAGFVHIANAEFNAAIRHIIVLHKQFGVAVPTTRNQAKKIASYLHGRQGVVIAAEHLAGNAHIMANQINENGKSFANYFLISEMNHHLMEGLPFPRTNPRTLAFILLQSSQYHQRNRKRFIITERVLRRAGINAMTYQTRGAGDLQQIVELLLLSSYVSFYLGILNGVDPSPIPVVDYFKKQLR
ncbi:MAG: SIS domain-containing protein [Patescibacteria group bacterium]